MKPGTVVYSTSDCGDHWEGKSVVIPKGIKGIFQGVREHPPQGGHEIGRRAFIEVPDSPGQKLLCCMPNEIDTFWSTEPPPPPPPPPPPRPTVWSRLRENPYA